MHGSPKLGSSPAPAAMPAGALASGRTHGSPKVGILVLNWNGHETTTNCLRALRDIDYPDYFVVVLDNGSERPGFDAIAEEFASLQILRSPHNLGFAGGMNRLMETAFRQGADYVWMLNSDAVCAPDTVSRLLAAATPVSRLGLASPLIADADRPGHYQVAGGRMAADGSSFEATTSPEQSRSWHEHSAERIAVVGTAALYSRDAYASVGGFWEKLFAYNEDIDLSIRCNRAGFRNIYATDLSVTHATKGPGGFVDLQPHLVYYMTRNEILVRRRYQGPIGGLEAVLWELRRRLADIVQADLYRRRPELAEAMLGGIWDGLRGRGGAYAPSRRMPKVLAAPLRWITPVLLPVLRHI